MARRQCPQMHGMPRHQSEAGNGVEACRSLGHPATEPGHHM